MSQEKIRLTVRCQHRVVLEVDDAGLIVVKCRDCSRATGKPVFHRVSPVELRERRGVVHLHDSDAENHQRVA
ncbi:MAG: hypothetical protein QM753_08760 [Thermomicrobiales bacterium]